MDKIKAITEIIEALVTSGSLIVGGIWVYWKFIRQQEKYPNIDFSTDINIIGKQNKYWIVELIAIIENKGKVQHKMNEFNFELSSILIHEEIDINKKWGGQVDFKNLICKGTFLNENISFFFIDPGTTAKYSFIAKVPEEVSFLILHSDFKYMNRNDYGHTAEKTICLNQSK